MQLTITARTPNNSSLSFAINAPAGFEEVLAKMVDEMRPDIERLIRHNLNGYIDRDIFIRNGVAVDVDVSHAIPGMEKFRP